MEYGEQGLGRSGSVFLGRRKERVNGRKRRRRPFRCLAVVLLGLAVCLMVRFPEKSVSLQNQQAQLAEAADAYYKAQSRNNQLKQEYGEVGSEDFVERTARREYGYCWYGETVYEVSNLDEIKRLTQLETGEVH